MAISVVTFQREFLPAFQQLNRDWIEKYFRLEAMDLHQLNHAEENILGCGGEIFFVLEEGSPVGTCAMVPHGESTYELCKMGVAPSARGKGYGDILMDTAIQWARDRDAAKVTILSNTVLEPAIQLYRKHGFEVVSLGSHPDYERCNIEMKLDL